MSPTFMDHPIFCTVAKLLHSVSNMPKSAEDILCQAGAEMNNITNLLDDMKKKVDINTNKELVELYNYYRTCNQEYLYLLGKYGMEIPPRGPGEDINTRPLPVRDPTRKKRAFKRSFREESKNLYSNVQQLGVSAQNVSNKVKLMSFEVLVPPPPLLYSDSFGSSSSDESLAYSPLSMEPGLHHRHSITSDPFRDPVLV